MARALTAPELVHLRSDGQYTKLYLAIMTPAVVLELRVDGDPVVDDELYTLTVDSASWGSGYSAAIKDMLVYVGTSQGGYEKGLVRLRENLSGSPTSMKVGEVSEIDWDDNDYLTIVEEFPLAPRHLYIDDNQVVYMDRDVTYSDQHENPDPVPVLGPIFTPVWLTGATVDVEFDGSNSWVVGADTVTGYVWTAPGASATSGMTTATPTITYDASGTYRVGCTLTSSNGSTYAGYRYVRAFDSGDMPTAEFVLESCRGSRDQQGWSFQVTAYAGVDRASVRDRALVCLFAIDHYGATEVSIGPIVGRENIVAIGWVDGESIILDPETGTVSFAVAGPQAWFNKMIGWPTGMEDTYSIPEDDRGGNHPEPSYWTEFKDLTTDKGLWHFLHWRSTATRCMDIQVTGDTRKLSLFEAGIGSLMEQFTNAAYSAVFAVPCCDRFGRLFIEIEPNLVPTASRSAWPIVQDIQTLDLRRPVTIERKPTASVSLVDQSGIFYETGAGTPYFSLSPGHIPKWYGASMERPDRLALSSQAQANVLAGLLLGWKNNQYPDVSFPMGSNHRMVDITPYQYLTMSISSEDTTRGIVWTTQAFLPKRVSFEHDPLTGVFLSTFGVEGETSEELSVDGDVPETPPPDAEPVEDPPDEDFDPEPTGGTGEVVIMSTHGGGIVYTLDALSGNPPTWYALNDGIDENNYIHTMDVDPAQPGAYAVCSDDNYHVYVNAGWRAGEAWVKALSNAEMLAMLGEDMEDCEVTSVIFTLSNSIIFVTCRVVPYEGFEKYTRWFYSLDRGLTWVLDQQRHGRGGGWSNEGLGEDFCNYTAGAVVNPDEGAFYDKIKRHHSGTPISVPVGPEFGRDRDRIFIGGRWSAASTGASQICCLTLGFGIGGAYPSEWGQTWYRAMTIPDGCDPEVCYCGIQGHEVAFGMGSGSPLGYEWNGPLAACYSHVDGACYFSSFKRHGDLGDTLRVLVRLTELMKYNPELDQFYDDEVLTPGWAEAPGQLWSPPEGADEPWIATHIHDGDTDIHYGDTSTPVTTIEGHALKVGWAMRKLVGDDADAVLYLGRGWVEDLASSDDGIFWVSQRTVAEGVATAWVDKTGDLYSSFGVGAITDIRCDFSGD